MSIEKIDVSVRGLVEYYYRSGDLDMVTYSSASRMLAGQRAHQKIQSSRPDEYESEVFLKTIYEAEEMQLEIRGRIDLLKRDESSVILEEIKTVSKPLAEISEGSFDKWWGQVIVYGAILLEHEGYEDCELHLVIYDLEKRTETILKRHYRKAELQGILNEMVDHYMIWAKKLAKWKRERNESLKKLEFPFSEYRKGQRKLAVRVYQTIMNQGQLLAEAPTGIGKTMSVMFSSLKGIGEDLIDKIFYFTARTTGKEVAGSAAEILIEKGLFAKFIILTAKDKICFNPEKSCHPDECRYAKGFYDRLDAAIDEMFDVKLCHSKNIREVCKKHIICPFEFSLMVSMWCDCVICDYNYGFDPRVYLRRFFAEGIERYHFLVDEAHNLVDRARSMYSAELGKGEVLNLRRQIKKDLSRIVKHLSGVNKEFLEKRKLMIEDDECDVDAPIFLEKPLRTFQKAADKWLAGNIQTIYRNEFLDFYFKVNFFINCLEKYDECYRTVWRREKSELSCKLYCLDPSRRIAEMLQNAQSTVFFSATLSPFEYYREIYGCNEETAFLRLDSPFPRENLLIRIKPVSTRYRHRKITLPDLVGNLEKFILRQTRNTMIFFPSYSYMQTVAGELESVLSEREVIIQESGMTEEERSEFLSRFTEESCVTGFTVMGGFFGEGIDLVGYKLNAIAIVGTGLPGIDFERELVREYYKDRSKGFEFAYTIPGITRVLQASGRLIRSESDKGELLLIDDRFLHARIRELLPVFWRINK